jgi:hypothetical protein
MLTDRKFVATIMAILALLCLVQADDAQARRRKMVINSVDMTGVDQNARLRDIYWPRGSGVAYLYSSRPWFGALIDIDGDGIFSDTVVVNQKASEMKPGYIDPADGTLKWAEPWTSLNTDLTVNETDLAGWPGCFMVDGEPDLRGDQDLVVTVQDMTSSTFESAPYKIGIQFMMHIWAFKRDASKDFVFIENTAINRSAYIQDTEAPIQTGPFDWKECYFAQRIDPDVGPNYNDDRSGFMKEKNLGFTFDRNFDDAGMEIGFMGVRLLKTPEVAGQELGLTNWTSIQNASSNYIVPDPTDDNTQYRIISAAPGQVLDPIYDPSKEFQFSGVTGDTRQIIVSGPFDMAPEDEQSMVMGFLFAYGVNDQPKYDTDEDVVGELGNLVETADAVKLFYDLGPAAKGPPAPSLSLIPGDSKVTLEWDEVQMVPANPNIEIVEYKVYRSFNAAGLDPQGNSDYELMGTFEGGSASHYSVVDTAPELINGWPVYYSITVVDALSGELGDLLGAGRQESEPLFSLANKVTPRSDAMGLGAGVDKQIRVVPNPFYAHASWDSSPTEKHVEFINLPTACSIRVYTLSGNLVNAVHHTNGSGTENFNLRNRFGEPLASGIYYWVVIDSRGEKETGKFIIVQ